MPSIVVSMGTSLGPQIELTKEVWDSQSNQWVDYLETTIGANLAFRIIIVNTGTIPLIELEVVDYLPMLLEYRDAANYTPSQVSPHQVTWEFNQLYQGASIEITFHAEIVYSGQDVNEATVSDSCAMSDSDTVTIVVEELDDNRPPITIKEYGQPFYFDGNKDWINSDTLIWLNATDYPLHNNCGVFQTLYRILRWDGTKWVVEIDWTIYTGPFTIPSECYHKIEFYSVDNCCNVEPINWQTVYVDNTPPCSDLTIEDDPDGYVWPYSTFRITAEDHGICILPGWIIYYKINDEEYNGLPNKPVAFQLYGRPSGLYIIEYWAVDTLGNEEPHHRGNYYLDGEPPTTTLSFSGPHQKENNHWQILPETLIVLTADDGEGVGIEKTLYVIAGTEKYIRYSEPFTMPGTGEYELAYYSFDLFGQMEKTNHQFIEVITRLDNSVPNEPPTPSGPDAGEANTLYSYSSQTIDSDGDRIRYYFDWDDGTGEWTEFVLSGQSVNISHQWKTNGYYLVRVKAQDELGGESDWSPALLVIISTAPNKPNRPDGETSCKKGIEYSYYTSTNDPDGDKVRYGWDWDGDKTVDQWTGYYNSDETIETPHVWTQEGAFKIRVKAKDKNGVESIWSEPLTVTITKNRALLRSPLIIKLFNRLLDLSLIHI